MMHQEAEKIAIMCIQNSMRDVLAFRWFLVQSLYTKTIFELLPPPALQLAKWLGRLARLMLLSCTLCELVRHQSICRLHLHHWYGAGKCWERTAREWYELPKNVRTKQGSCWKAEKYCNYSEISVLENKGFKFSTTLGQARRRPTN